MKDIRAGEGSNLMNGFSVNHTRACSYESAIVIALTYVMTHCNLLIFPEITNVRNKFLLFASSVFGTVILQPRMD